MHAHHTFGLLAGLALVAGCPKSTPSPAPEATPSPMEAISAEVLAAVDAEVDPCTDFYEYACNGWFETNEIPADKARWGRSFSVIAEQNRAILRQVLEDAATAGTGDARLGAYYKSCMNTEAINAAGGEALAGDFALIDKVIDGKTLARALSQLLMADAYVGVMVEADFDNPDMNMLHVAQGGMGLPSRDYYFPEDEKGKKVLADYELHMARMFTLAGYDEAAAADAAKRVLALETTLAEASWAPAELRNIEKMKNPMPMADLQAMTPNFPWKVMLAGLGLEGVDRVNVLTPDFFKPLNALVVSQDWNTARDYLKWAVINGAADHLSAEFDEANFAFYGKSLSGQQQQEDRWKRCSTRTDGALGDLLGQAFVDAAFPGDSKSKAKRMVDDLYAAFDGGLPELAWMDDATRELARQKLQSFTDKIGYPDAWETYEGLEVGADYFANVRAVAKWNMADSFAKVGQPVDKTEWHMTPPTVNAYYNPLVNEIVFPAGILQPPFFSREFPAAMNYGAMGMVIGHEITHGFDDEGRKFAPDGSVKSWWAPEASERFDEAAQCVDDLYSSYEVQPELFVNGKLTLGENIADLGGIKLAHRAYNKWLEDGNTDPSVGDFTGEQLLFVSYAQGWCTLMRPEAERLRVTTDPHSPAKFRVNGPLSQLPSFGEAFDCPVGSPMRPEKICTVW